MGKKRLIAEIDEEKFYEFKESCKELGVSMGEVIELGLDAGLALYVAKSLKEEKEELKGRIESITWVESKNKDKVDGYFRNYITGVTKKVGKDETDE